MDTKVYFRGMKFRPLQTLKMVFMHVYLFAEYLLNVGHRLISHQPSGLIFNYIIHILFIPCR